MPPARHDTAWQSNVPQKDPMGGGSACEMFTIHAEERFEGFRLE